MFLLIGYNIPIIINIWGTDSIRWACDNHVTALLMSYFSDSSVCTGCCSTLDHILTYIFKKRNKPKSSLSPADSISALLQLPEARPEILQVCNIMYSGYHDNYSIDDSTHFYMILLLLIIIVGYAIIYS